MSESDSSGDDQSRKECPECGSTASTHIEFRNTPSLTDESLIEARSCDECYAGWEVSYAVESVEVTHPPETE